MRTARYSIEEQRDWAVGSMQFLRGGESPSSGYWTVSPDDAPGPFREEFRIDETLIVVSGMLGVADDEGHEVTLSAGDSAFFDGGTSATLTVLAPLVTFWVEHRAEHA
ncbi:MAG: cupin domain-containing protein [Leucobacter sp.]